MTTTTTTYELIHVIIPTTGILLKIVQMCRNCQIRITEKYVLYEELDHTISSFNEMISMGPFTLSDIIWGQQAQEYGGRMVQLVNDINLNPCGEESTRGFNKF